MGMSVYMKRAYVAAEAFDKTLTASSFGSGKFVMVQADDGSSFFFRDAIVYLWKDPEYVPNRINECYMVFTEHYGFHVYNVDDYNVFQLKHQVVNFLPTTTTE